MIIIKCDICNATMPEQVLVVHIMDSEGSNTDVCSPQCLGVLAEYLGPDMQEEDTESYEGVNVQADSEPKARLVPQEPDKRYPTEEETEQITGVIKRY